MILGVDPGLASTGYAVLDGERLVAWGTVRTDPGPLPGRLALLASEMRRIASAHPISEAALEDLFAGRNTSSAILVAQARGAVLVALTGMGIRCHEYKPASVKLSLTGHGSAGKAQVGRMVRIQVGAPGLTADEHAIDAVAIALHHHRAVRMAAALRAAAP